MEFEWDEAKANANLEKHGVAFEAAVAIFADSQRFVIEDLRFKYQKLRYSVHGFIQGRLHVVVFTFRDSGIRIISARKANKREQIKHGHRSIQA